MQRLAPLLSFVVLAVVLAGCGGGAASTPTDTGITVSGRFLLPDGTAASGITALIADEVVTPAADGSFQAAGIEAPYDVSVLISVPAADVVVSFQGITREDPVLVLPDLGSVPPERQATISFDLYYNETAVDPTVYDYAVLSGPVDYHPYEYFNLKGATLASRPVTWSGPATSSARIVAAQGTVLGAQPRMFTEYRNFASRDNISLEAGAAAHAGLSFSPVATGTITGTTTAPPGFTITRRSLGLMFGEEDWGVISYENHSSAFPIVPGFSLATPDVSGFSYYVALTAELGDADVRTRVAVADATATDVNVQIPAPPQLLQPADGQVGVTGSTVFEWTPMADGIYVMAAISPTPDAPYYVTFTDDTEARLPDVGALGISLPGAATYTWGVQAFAPADSIDMLASGLYFEDVGVTHGISTQRSATTAP